MQADQPSDTPPRLCLDPLTERPVFVAPQRGGKPADRDLVAAAHDDRRGPLSWCPFCAGNEHRTPPAVVRMPVDEDAVWRARIVPNRYPITCGPATLAAGASMPTGESPARGIHEVVIESPRHERSILAVPPDEWRGVWDMCRRRLEMLADSGLAWATVFKNSGPRAGASLEHVHSQLVAVEIVPPAIRAELAALDAGADPFARLLATARTEGRVVAETAELVAFVPPAPRQPFETWLVTREPVRHLHASPPAAVAELAMLTRDVVTRLEKLAPGCHYNWWLHQAPYGRSPGEHEATCRWHWHLEILPRLTELAGFELGTGCHIATVSAAESARRLREAGDG
ncbi:MAG: DUF4921 family protein [Pirellulales bacterium]